MQVQNSGGPPPCMGAESIWTSFTEIFLPALRFGYLLELFSVQALVVSKKACGGSHYQDHLYQRTPGAQVEMRLFYYTCLIRLLTENLRFLRDEI